LLGRRKPFTVTYKGQVPIQIDFPSRPDAKVLVSAAIIARPGRFLLRAVQRDDDLARMHAATTT